MTKECADVVDGVNRPMDTRRMHFREEELGGLTVRITGGDDGAGSGKGPVWVLMHGYGAPGTDLLPFAGEIPAAPGTRFVFPEAPLTLPYEMGVAGRAWWHIDMQELAVAMFTGRVGDLRKRVPDGLSEANAKVAAMLSGLEKAIGMQRDTLVLGGFSQGAMLACDVVLRSSDPLAALVMMSGSYLAEPEWSARMPSRKGLRVFMSHGRQDPLLPFSLAEALRDALMGAGLDVTWVPFSGGHGVAPEVIDALGEFAART
jgi:phospholipase/carboxylesterase